MSDLTTLLAFALVVLGMAITPGPNMIYVASRSLSQGPRAGLISIAGLALSFALYVLCAAFGITALVLAVPYAYDALRLAGAAYLLWLAWQAVRPGGRSAFEPRVLPPDGPRRLFLMGFLTSLLNPKIAALYLSLLPQFVDPERGHMLAQLLILGFVQVVVSVMVQSLVAFGAGSFARFLAEHPVWATVQRYVMGTLLAAFAVRMATEGRR